MADGVSINQGTAKIIATDDVSGTQYQVIKLDLGGDGASSPFTGTIPTVSNLAGGTITSVQGGSIRVVAGTETITSGSVNVVAGTMNAGTLNAGTINAGTVTALNALIPAFYDNFAVTYPDGTTETYTFKSGAGTVRTVTIYYTDSTKGSISAGTSA